MIRSKNRSRKSITPNTHNPLQRSALWLGIALASSATMVQAQQPELEEITVTGSFIRNSDFSGASPVDTVDQETLLTYGSANIGQYIRDLTYTQNVDTVANVLGGAGGGQDSNSAQFNLRGLGVSSTLTLLDGRRNINSGAISAILPDIATDRIEVVLDGGSALYGSDAVAGVVNLIPIKEFEGLRFRSFYGRDENADFEEPKLSMLWGNNFSNGLNVVAALEVGKKTPLQRGERPEYLRVDNATFIGAPGHYQLANGAPYLDPDCGAYNEGLEDKGIDGSFPSGYPIAGGLLCGFHYAQWTDYNREANDYVSYANATYPLNDNVSLEAQMTLSYRESIFHTEPVTPIASAWYDNFIIPANHPANPTGQAVRPGVFGIGTWTVWNGLEQGEGTKPSYLGESSFQNDRYQYTTATYKFGSEFEFGDSGWFGEAWLGYQTYEVRVDTMDGNAVRLEAALNGRGGPNGNEWFNPFASRDIRSPNYDADRSDGLYTNNTQEVVDWLFESGDYNQQEDSLLIFDAIVTGDLFEMPAGTLGAAFGIAMRDRSDVADASPLSKVGMDFSNSAGIAAPLGVRTEDNSMTQAVFAELQVPLLENLSMQLAARYEDFTDLGLETTTPKVAMRWQPTEDLAIRGSWGESFLAPSATDVGPYDRSACANVRTGQDPITGNDLLGTLACASKNPFLQPENSEIWSVGFTWEGIEDLSISLDYQEIEYTDRIVTLSSQDVVNQQFFSATDALGINRDSYDPTPGSADREAVLNWIASNPSTTITREPGGNITEIVSIADNINTNIVDVLDLTATYNFELNDWGNFNMALNASYYVTYEYAGLDGVLKDARGKRNADTALSPPLPEIVANLRLGWNRGDHAASILAKYTDAVTFDGVFATGTTPPEVIPDSWIANANYTYFFNDLFNTSGSVTLGINNLFDWQPILLPVTGGFESRLYDNFGRMYSLTVDFEL